MKADGATAWALEPEPTVGLAEDLVADAFTLAKNGNAIGFLAL